MNDEPRCLRNATTGELSFSPPVYRQRYMAALDVIERPTLKGQILKVVDFGCSDLSFVKLLRDVENLDSVLAVDCDLSTLKDNLYRLQPENRFYFKPREKPFDITVMHGSICDPDYRLLGCDAVVCIEVIEHLNPGTLDRLPHNIFGYIEPLIVVITTPNADFNVLFPFMKEKNGFRHYDHRFEWTREQFQDWANNIIMLYPNYTVEFEGIGPGPEDSSNVGCCSQMALFTHKNYSKKTDIVIPVEAENSTDSKRPISEELDILTNKYKSNSIDSTDIVNTDDVFIWENINWEKKSNVFYNVVEKINYPFYVDNRSESEKLLSEIQYKIRRIATYDSVFFDEENYIWKIPIDYFLPPFDEGDLDFLRETLVTNGYTVINDFLIRELDESQNENDYDVEEDPSFDETECRVFSDDLENSYNTTDFHEETW